MRNLIELWLLIELKKKKVISVSLEIDKDKLFLIWKVKSLRKKSPFNYVIEDAIKDSYKRMIGPSIEREIRSELTERAEDEATKNFSLNLEKLLMQPPMKDKMVLGFDPAYRTGCKLAVVDNTGKKLDIKVIYHMNLEMRKRKVRKYYLI